MASSEKRCLYEVLGLNRDCNADEIRSAYRKLALQRHPDKLVQSGVSESEATASFQELVNAYEVLSDPRERAWYDSHRSQILFASSNSSKSKSNSTTLVPDLFSFFSNSVFSGYSDTGKGFYKVFGDVFDKIYQNELNFADKLGLGVGSVKEAPLMGNLKCQYSQVNAFYGYWLGFVTVMDFVWVDQYDAMAGPNRKSRRVMEDENKKLRKKARREYNETVRGLAEFVKKRDKRVIDMQVKRNEEMDRKREEEKEKKRKMERERLERARAYEEPDWAKVEEVDDGVIEEEEVVEESEKKKELYCVVCGKKFKSDKQWKNHEQSKKHQEKVAEFRKALSDEERENGEEEEEVLGGDEGNGFVSADDGVDELQEQFENGLGIQEPEQNDGQGDESSEEEVLVDVRNLDGAEGVSDDDEATILKAMLSGHKNRKKAGKLRKPKVSFTEVYIEVDNDEMYNNRKDGADINKLAEVNKGHDESSHVEEKPTHNSAETETNSNEGDRPETNSKEVNRSETKSKSKQGDQPETSQKTSKQALDKKGASKKETNAKSKIASKGKKQKATSDGHVCEKCGEDFESRNKLHKHLSDTGHASLKSR
ncbi:hypothetical protein LguiA_028305 [Lonicera macranthoides]